jgi:hypothetical protein
VGVALAFLFFLLFFFFIKFILKITTYRSLQA